jgi:hypothetical protein
MSHISKEVWEVEDERIGREKGCKQCGQEKLSYFVRKKREERLGVGVRISVAGSYFTAIFLVTSDVWI